MPISPLLPVRPAKDISCAYQARSVEAIRLCRTLEQELVTRNGLKGNVHDVPNLQPQNVGLPQPEYIYL